MPEAMTQSEVVIKVRGLTKTFTLHTQNGVRLPVFEGLDMDIPAGACTALYGPSGCGKSTLLRSLYGNYLVQEGSITVRHRGEEIDIARATPRTILAIRRETIGYVSQFLRVIPRVPTIDVVAEPLLALGVDRAEATAKAAALLKRLNIPEALWHLAPATFSGGEQQRINIARGFAADYPILLLDEPTASLDSGNQEVVVSLIGEAKARGAAIVGIFHDDDVRETVADHIIDLARMKEAA
jgi:alpha-D-ribose 1-methylphosphonate 5-triphosphate synthase subunit PhnL